MYSVKLDSLYYTVIFLCSSFIAQSEKTCRWKKNSNCLLGNKKTPGDNFETEEIVMSFILELTFLRYRMPIM